MKIFPVYYLPPVSWFAAAAQEKQILLEACQHYRKQTYFNRLYIAGPNGRQLLSIPVLHTGERTPVRLTRISYDAPWQKIHWKSFETAYRPAPYFEYYEDRFREFYENRTDSLFEWNLGLTRLAADLLGISVHWTFTESWEEGGSFDLRAQFDARGVPPRWFRATPYEQVFGDFVPDASIFDLLCNLGPDAAGYLEENLNLEHYLLSTPTEAD